MAFLSRHERDRRWRGERVRALGEPFRVSSNPPGVTWQAVVCADGRLRPAPAAELAAIDDLVDVAEVDEAEAARRVLGVGR